MTTTPAQIEALLREAQPYVCQFLYEATNYGRAQILNDKINTALTAAAEAAKRDAMTELHISKVRTEANCDAGLKINYPRSYTAAAEVGELVECDQCGGSGFETPGTGYGNVCSKCGGLKYLPVNALELALKQDKLEPIIKHAVAATIERCAQVVVHLIENSTPNERGRLEDALSAIRALKDKV